MRFYFQVSGGYLQGGICQKLPLTLNFKSELYYWCQEMLHHGYLTHAACILPIFQPGFLGCLSELGQENLPSGGNLWELGSPQQHEGIWPQLCESQNKNLLAAAHSEDPHKSHISCTSTWPAPITLHQIFTGQSI